ncbi:MAG: hypothetical protein ABI977_19785 [Acidobacteriota bacterium]
MTRIIRNQTVEDQEKQEIVVPDQRNRQWPGKVACQMLRGYIPRQPVSSIPRLIPMVQSKAVAQPA